MPVRFEAPPASARPAIREAPPYVAPAPDPGAVPLFSALVPVFNEEARLPGVMRGLLGACAEVGEPFEIIVVDDGSRDESSRIADELAVADRRVRCLRHGRNEGLGAAMRTGIRAARGTYVVASPVDSPLDADQIRAFLEVMEPSAAFAYLPGRKACDIAVGVRSERPGYRPWMRLCSWVYRWSLRVAFRMWLRDFNWICMYRRSVFDRIDFEADDFIALPEILVRAKRAGLVLEQVRCPMKAREPGEGTVRLPARPAMAFGGIVRLWIRLHFGTSRPASPLSAPKG